MKTRLNEDKRSIITGFINQKVRFLARKQLALDAVEEVIEAEVLIYLAATYPIQDMLILKKYDSTYETDEITVSVRKDVYARLKLSQKVLIPKEHRWTHHFFLDNPLFTDWHALDQQVSEHVKTRMDDYRTLIRRSKTVEDVLEAFPLLSEIQEELTTPEVRYPVAVVSDAVLTRITQDVVALSDIGEAEK